MDDGSLETLNVSASNLTTENGRMDTFRGWPHSAPVNPLRLAQAGFYYLGEGDRVRCAFCGGTLKGWQVQDDPWQEHTKHFSHCSFIKSHTARNPVSHPTSQSHQNIPAPASHVQSHQNVPVPASHTQSVSHQNIPAHAGQIHMQSGQLGEPEIAMGAFEVGRLNPRHPEYQSMDIRRLSFENWTGTAVQKPEQLADAGFFYTGQMDCVRCFCCSGALCNWEATDVPWEEHARWFSSCPYLLQQKGRGFVAEMKRKYGSAVARPMGTSSPASSPARRGAAGDTEKLQRVMQSETVKEALGMGFTLQQVQTAVRKILSASGERNVDLSTLVSVIVGEDITTVSQRAGEATSQHTQEAEQSSRPGTDDRTLCKICMDREVEVTFLPCGHLVSCYECSKRVKECPVCRRTVKASIRTFLS